MCCRLKWTSGKYYFDSQAWCSLKLLWRFVSYDNDSRTNKISNWTRLIFWPKTHCNMQQWVVILTWNHCNLSVTHSCPLTVLRTRSQRKIIYQWWFKTQIQHTCFNMFTLKLWFFLYADGFKLGLFPILYRCSWKFINNITSITSK